MPYSYCTYLNTDEEVELLKDEGAEGLVDHLLFYLLSGVDYDPQIKTTLLNFIAVQYPNISDEDFGMGGYEGEEAQLNHEENSERYPIYSKIGREVKKLYVRGRGRYPRWRK